ncbi:MAG TPA: transglycosylase SLT domain-containing protein [Desulfobaccales bacterium]
MSSPAIAAIERSVDSRGVVHIRNTGPAARHSPAAAEAPAGSPVAAPQANQPDALASEPPAANLAPQPQGPQPEAQATPANPAPQAAPSGVAKQVAPETSPGTKSAREEESGNRLALRKVSYPAVEPAPVQVQEESKTIRALAPEGAIKCTRDHRGVLHISNVTPGQESAPPAPAASGRGSGSQPPAGETTTEPPLQKVSLDETSAVSPGTPAAPAAMRSAPAPGVIRRYRDSRGVLHIENVDPAGPEAKPPLLPARAGKMRKHIEIFGSDGASALPLKKAAWPAEAVNRGPPPGPPREIAPPKGEILAQGSIRRYRDAKGVMHIKSVEPPKPLAVPGPMLLARPELGNRGSPAYAGIPPPPETPTAAFVGARPPPAGAGITALKDRRGRLTISNQEAELQVAATTPREQAMAQLAAIFQEASLLYGLPVSLIQSLIKVESNFVPWAVSPKGAMGLMQLMPGTAAFLGVRDAFDPRENILGGCRYLRLLLDYFGGSLPLALAAYNAGHGRVVSCGYQIPPIKETQDFVTQVLGRYFSAAKRGPRPWV